MRITGWMRGLLVLSLSGVMIADCAAALLFSQVAVAETQQTGTPLSNPTTSTTHADQAAKITPEQEAALVEARKLLKEASEVAESIKLPSSLFMNEAKIRIYEGAKQQLLRRSEVVRFWAGDFSTAGTSRQYWDLTIAQIQYGRLQEAIQTATIASEARFSFSAETLVILKLLSDAGDLSGAMQVAEAHAQGPRYGGPARKQYEAELMAYMARRQAEAGKPEARETLARAIEVIRSNKNAPYQTAPYFQHVGWAAIGCAQAAMGDPAGGEASMRYAVQAAVNLPREEYEGQRGWTVALIGRTAAESELRNVSQEAFQEALRLAHQAAEPHVRAKVMAKVAVSQSQGGDRIGGQRTLEEAITFARNLPDHKQRLRTLGTIVEQQFEGGDSEGAAATLERRKRWVETISGASEREAEIKSIQWWDAKLLTPQAALGRVDALEGKDEEQAAALAWAAYLLARSTEPVSTPEILQRLSKTAATLLEKPLPNDRKRADQYLGNLARVQAVADGASPALQTVNRISDSSAQKNNYLRLLSLLTTKKDVAGAKQVAALLNFKEDGLLISGDSGDTLGDKLRELVKVQAEMGDTSGALQFARQQVSPYAKVQSLIGVALGLMERIGVYDLRQHLPASLAINKGAIDTLTLGCSTL